MKPRRAAAGGAAALLLCLLLSRDAPRDLLRRAQLLARSFPLESSVRRANGSACAFDRPFCVFLESARRSLPPGTPGVAILGAAPTDSVVYVAAYHLAPVPVAVAPRRMTPGWLLAVYGSERPPGWRVVSPLWKGVLLAPAP